MSLSSDIMMTPPKRLSPGLARCCMYNWLQSHRSHHCLVYLMCVLGWGNTILGHSLKALDDAVLLKLSRLGSWQCLSEWLPGNSLYPAFNSVVEGRWNIGVKYHLWNWLVRTWNCPHMKSSYSLRLHINVEQCSVWSRPTGNATAIMETVTNEDWIASSPGLSVCPLYEMY